MYHVHHSSRVSSLAYQGEGGPAIYRSRAKQLECIIARILKGGGYQAIIFREHRSSRVSSVVFLGGGRPCNHSLRVS